MRGIVHPLKEVAIEELKKGTPASQVSAKYGIAYSTLTAWIKTLPADAKKSKWNYRNRMISVMRKVNIAEAKISDLIADYIVCDITDDEWESIQKFIQHELVTVSLSVSDEDKKAAQILIDLVNREISETL